MGRILALDIGGKRTGIAVTDPLQIIATGMEGVDTNKLIPYLTGYVGTENVELIVVGKPVQMNNEMSESWNMILGVVAKIKAAMPDIPLDYYDERFTSKIALQSMKMAGAGKSEMKNKKTVDMVSATLILQNYMEAKNFK